MAVSDPRPGHMPLTDDARPADDRVGAVLVGRPRLARAVVVGAPDDKGASRTPTETRSVPSGLPRARRAPTGFVQLRPVVVSSVWPGRIRRPCGIVMWTSLTVCLRSAKSPRRSSRGARVAGEDEPRHATKETIACHTPASGLPRRQVPPWSLRARSRPVAGACPRARRGGRGRAFAAHASASVGARRRRQAGARPAPGIDEHGHTLWLVADHAVVREVAGIRASAQEHGR
jgi:hypothetical protein